MNLIVLLIWSESLVAGIQSFGQLFFLPFEVVLQISTLRLLFEVIRISTLLLLVPGICFSGFGSDPNLNHAIFYRSLHRIQLQTIRPPPKRDNDNDPPHAVPDHYEPIIARSSSFHSPSTSPTSRSHQSSPNHSPRLGPSRLSSFHRSHSSFSSSPFKWNAWGFLKNWKLQLNPPQQHKGKLKAGKSWYRTKRVKGLLLLIGLLGSFFLVNWIMLTRLQDEAVHPITELSRNSSADSVSVPVQVGA
ncbi:uncharacterized protein LOC114730926 [Neltuma alba]|uniref:uncharacterized protein LOC114730926 n=1 Tax=Neltuma alba TaxID=207710 RepID=UPI0010A2F3BC|nr:uncharacterized protein LOC114730926 [Prosopis alba]